MDLERWLNRKYGKQYPDSCIVLFRDGSGCILKSLASILNLSESMESSTLFKFHHVYELQNHLEGNEE